MCAKPFLSILIPGCDLYQYIALTFLGIMLLFLLYWCVTHLWLGADMYIEKYYSWRWFRLFCVCFIAILPTTVPWLIEPFWGTTIQHVMESDLQIIGWIFVPASCFIGLVAVLLSFHALQRQRENLRYVPKAEPPDSNLFGD